MHHACYMLQAEVESVQGGGDEFPIQKMKTVSIP